MGHEVKTWMDSFGTNDFMWLYDHFEKDDSIEIPGDDCNKLILCNKFGTNGPVPALPLGGRPSFEEGPFYPAHSDYILPRRRWDRCGRCGVQG